MTDQPKEATPEEVLEVYRDDANAIRLQMSPRSWSGTAIMRLWDALDASVKENARLLKVERAAKKMDWYAEKARAIKRYAEASPPMDQAMMAVVTELALDGGARYDALRRLVEGEGT